MISIENISLRICIDADKIKNVLSYEEYVAICDDDDGIPDFYEVVEKYGTLYVKDDVLLRITSTDGLKTDVTAHKLAEVFSFNLLLEAMDEASEGFPMLDARVISEYIFISVCCGGADGGFIIIDATNGKWIFSTTPDDMAVIRSDNVVWIPDHKLFVCAGDLTGFKDLQSIVDLTMVTLEGMFSQYYLGLKTNQTTTESLNILEQVDDIECMPTDDKLVTYDKRQGVLYFHPYKPSDEDTARHYKCNIRQLIQSSKPSILDT